MCKDPRQDSGQSNRVKFLFKIGTEFPSSPDYINFSY